ncbi:MAG: tetratricopeptide repeat protein [Chthoniobacterales bacterium]
MREAEAVCEADKAGQLIRLPTGDGMALVFTDSLETPVEAALQISRALRLKPGLGVRMGIHSGPVQHTSGVNERANIAGAGINLAQRVMDCGAVQRDPSFYAAWCQLVFVSESLYSLGYDHAPARLAAAEEALRHVAQLRPDAAETHLVRGWHLYYGPRDYDGALAELKLAARGLANDPRVFETTGYILRRQGKYEEGLRALEQAVALDPRNVFVLAQIALSHQLLRQYPEEAAVLDSILKIEPDDLSAATSRAGLDLLWRADPKPLHRLIDQVHVEQPARIGEAAVDWLICALAERDWPAAEQALTALGNDPFINDWSVRLGRHFAEGLLARAMGDEARAQRAFGVARTEQAALVQKQTDYGPALCVLGLIDAALGHKEAALAEGRRAMELLPMSRDANDGQRLQVYFALIAAWAGEKDLALEQLAATAATPGGSTIASNGMLKLLPFWDPVRGEPRFEKIVASLAPKN